MRRNDDGRGEGRPLLLAGFEGETKSVEVFEQDKADVLLTLRRR